MDQFKQEQYLYEVYTTTVGEPVIVVAKAEDYDTEQVLKDQERLAGNDFKGDTILFTKRYPITMNVLKSLLDFNPPGAAFVTQCTVESFCQRYADFHFLSQKVAERLRQNINWLSTQGFYRMNAYSMNTIDRGLFSDFIRPYSDYEPSATLKERVGIKEEINYSAMVITGITLAQVLWQDLSGNYQMSLCWLALINYFKEKRVQLLLPEFLGKKLAPYITVEQFPKGVVTYSFPALPWSYLNDFLHTCQETAVRPHGKLWKSIADYIMKSRIAFENTNSYWRKWRAGTAKVRCTLEEDLVPVLMLNSTYNNRQLRFLNYNQLNACRQFILDVATYAESYLEDFGHEGYGYWESPEEEGFEFLEQNYREGEFMICPTVEMSGTGIQTKLTLHDDFYCANWQRRGRGLVAHIGPLEVEHTIYGEIIKIR